MCSNFDRGLLAVAVDPDFSTNGYVYLFYTHNKTGGTCPGSVTDPNAPVNRVSRFVISGDTVSLASEKILIDNIPSGEHHNGADLRFGKDNLLYAITGDGSCDYAGDSGCYARNDASRDTHVLLGKVLRITRDGGIPAGNPYTGADSARCNTAGQTNPGKYCQETFASGLRNPFRFAFDPDATGIRFFIGDVGQDAWEEIDEGEAGADYGWNICEGAHDNPNRSGSVDCSAAPYTPPVHEYSHNTGCTSITGQAFVPDSLWPAEYDDAYLFTDFVCEKIFELRPKAGGGYEASEFASGVSPTAMAFGPHGSGQALYYTTYSNGSEPASIHRITYSADANLVPTASVETTSPNYGPTPLTVNFDGSASADPDGDTPLTYLWDFGDGTGPEETSTPTTSHTYTTVPAESYTAQLKVRDARGAVSDPETVKVFPGNDPPEPTIESPAADKLFKVGEEITLQGSATDPQDGQLPESALSWEVLQHHNGSHTHSYESGTGSSLTITTPAPEELFATGPGNHLEIRLTTTDSQGLTKTVSQDLQPNRVNVTLQSEPTGLSLEVDNQAFVAPRTLVSWEGYTLSIYAPSPQALSGTTYAFDSWSNGGGQRQDVTTGAMPSTYKATFKGSATACTITGTSGNDVLNGTEGDDVICGLGGNDTIKGLGGNDTLQGGGGNDTIEGGAGDDTLKGENNSDKLYGGEGNDTLDGGAGTDTASFKSSATGVQASLVSNTATGEGSDTLAGVERLEGSNFNDTLTGSSAANTLTGLSGADTITGGDGNDTLGGGGGNDTLNSKDTVNGNDTLNGGAGVDTCTTDATEKSITSCP